MKIRVILSVIFLSLSSPVFIWPADCGMLNERPQLDQVWPVDYDLHIETNYNKDRQSGRVKITVLAKEETPMIQLGTHWEHLIIESVAVADQTGNRLPVKELGNKTDESFLDIFLNEQNPLKKDHYYTVDISFTGLLFEKPYIMESVKIDGRISNYSITKFIARIRIGSDARKAFPCFDEPRFKATFRLSITHDKHLVALANMPVDRLESVGNRTTTTFVRSPVKIPTHLIGWAVGEFQSIEQTTDSGVKVRAVTINDRVDRTALLLSTSVKLIQFYEPLFQLSFRLPKLDILTLPIVSTRHHKTPNPEAAGFFAYTRYFQFDSNLSPAVDVKNIVRELSYNLASNWFGNLLSTSQWNDGWLIEGLNKFYGNKALSSVNFGIAGWPDDISDHFLIDELHPTIESDCSWLSEPIRLDQLNKLVFLQPNDKKAAAVLRMVEDMIGQQAFHSAARRFLDKYNSGFAGINEFLAEINQVYDKKLFDGRINNITDFVNKWLVNVNLPVVTVTRKSTGDGLLVQQQRFVVGDRDSSLLGNESDTNHNDQIYWSIPIKIITGSGAKISFILDKPSNEISIRIAEDDWFKLNPGQVGYYIVNYSLDDWHKLTSVLANDHNVMSPADRANLVFDAFLLANAGRLKHSVAFELILFLANDNHLLPWQAAYQNLIKLFDKKTFCFQEEACLKQLVQGLTFNLYSQLGWNDQRQREEPIDKRILRSHILDLSCRSRSADCLDAAAERLTMLIQNSDAVGPDTRQLVYKYGVERRGSNIDRREWQWLLERYDKETLAVEQDRLMMGLSMVQSPELLSELFQSAITGRHAFPVNDQYRRFSHRVINHNPIGRDVVWSLFKINWQRLISHEKYTDLGRYNQMSLTLSDVVEKLDRREQLDEVVEFFKRNPEAVSTTKMQQEWLAKIRDNIERKSAGGFGNETVCINWQRHEEVQACHFVERRKPANHRVTTDDDDLDAFDALDLFSND